MRTFKEIYGVEELMPGRKQPFTPDMWARVESLQEGAALTSGTNPTVCAARLHAGRVWFHREKFQTRRVRPQLLGKCYVSRDCFAICPADLVVRRIRRDFRCQPETEEPCHE